MGGRSSRNSQRASFDLVHGKKNYLQQHCKPKRFKKKTENRKRSEKEEKEEEKLHSHTTTVIGERKVKEIDRCDQTSLSLFLSNILTLCHPRFTNTHFPPPFSHPFAVFLACGTAQARANKSLPSPLFLSSVKSRCTSNSESLCVYWSAPGEVSAQGQVMWWLKQLRFFVEEDAKGKVETQPKSVQLTERMARSWLCDE